MPLMPSHRVAYSEINAFASREFNAMCDSHNLPAYFYVVHTQNLRCCIGCCLGEWPIYRNISKFYHRSAVNGNSEGKFHRATAVKFRNGVVKELFTPNGQRINIISPRNFCVCIISFLLASMNSRNKKSYGCSDFTSIGAENNIIARLKHSMSA